MTNSVDSEQMLLQKPSDQDLHCFHRQCLSWLSRARVNMESFSFEVYQRLFIGIASLFCKKSACAFLFKKIGQFLAFLSYLKICYLQVLLLS